MDPMDELNRRREDRDKVRAERRKNRTLMGICLILSLLVLLSLGFLGIARGILRRKTAPPPATAASNPADTEAATTAPPPTEPDRVIHFVAGGDINVTDKTVATEDFTDYFTDILPVLSSGDLTSVNLEGVIAGEPYGSVRHSAPPQLLTALQAAGVDLVQTANSMSIAGGINGLQSTLNAVRNAKMEPLGTYANRAEFRDSSGYVLREVNGLKIALVAFTKGMDGMGLPEGSEDCVNLLYRDYDSTYQKVDEKGIKAVLDSVAQQNPDITIALLHWGSEYNNKVSKTQDKITNLLLSNGVDAILGTHSHYVQTVQFDPQKGTLVAYSLGDLVGDAEMAGTNYSVLLDLEITKSGATGKTTITGFDYTPVFLDTKNGLRILRIREAMTAYENRALGRVDEATYNAMAEVLKKIDSRMGKTPEEAK